MTTEGSATIERRRRAQGKLLKPGEPLDTCAQCGYEKGFHIVPNKRRRTVRASPVSLLLKCPNCGAVYDVGIAAAE